MKLVFSVFLSAFLFLLPAFAIAAGSGHGEAHAAGGVPMAVVFQAINFLIYVGVLYFLLRKPVLSFFTGREQAFKQALVKAESAKREAEAKKREIQDRLNRLETTADESVAQAKAEAAALKARILKEASELSQKLRDEAHSATEFEVARAKHELREELLVQSVAAAREMLADQMAEPDQKRLQTEFVDKIQVVR